ncbi:MAG: histidine triad nucleotide-binding protein [Candidatus Marinimicrobia bacterium]|jgi:histidine triad (HIT) family protein|nr:histidine triad nucleotide-binding protein [Candidatus Neomarinimicrobiota bacterium]MBT3634462.1 histidine triad nucleotide-binding protein [Candidatus Neomarinimicrobiota bacterium]MBT3683289.1 histidine triad nucleotide-binding protein [Candidatus Neomarinimicrobiota bacterium]MBT3760177.1 histidine triad nucleotide-binding protein [Candidatus Neomarinimicrobiota bacterium]MBT3896272.1 histidine triad nucleotide-binding protein [Candidatus Neomarinimicrobiota bacterium]
MNDCLFCKIIEKIIPADIVAENENVLAFKDIDSKAPTHILIIPKNHIESTLELTGDNINILGEMGLMANNIAKTEGIDEAGYRWVINTGINGGQSVYHIHLHLLGGRRLGWPPG